MSRSRGYVITIQVSNIESWQTKFKNFFESCIWSIRQLEKAPTTGKLHIQAAIYYANAKRIGAVTKCFTDAHVEVMKGTCDQSRIYCSKEESRVKDSDFISYGTMPVQGKRMDIESFTDALVEGQSITTVALANPTTFVRHFKGLRAYAELLVPHRSHMTKSEVFWGPTGSGKSVGVRKILEGKEYFQLSKGCCTNNVTWFDGYDPLVHKYLVLDDFYGWIPLHTLLNIIDSHPMKVQTKGGSLQFLCEVVYITSNVDPQEWYSVEKEAVRAAYLRRLSDPWTKVSFVGYGPDKDLEWCPCDLTHGAQKGQCPLSHDTSGPSAIARGAMLPPKNYIKRRKTS